MSKQVFNQEMKVQLMNFQMVSFFSTANYS
jgi:hypothetical protein